MQNPTCLLSVRKVRTSEEERTSPNRAGVAEPCLKIWDKNFGQNLGPKFGTDGETDGQTLKITTLREVTKGFVLKNEHS